MGPPPAVQTQGFFTCGAKATSSSWRGHFGRASGRGTPPKPTPPKKTLTGSQGWFWAAGGQLEATPASEEALGVPVLRHQLKSNSGLFPHSLQTPFGRQYPEPLPGLPEPRPQLCQGLADPRGLSELAAELSGHHLA